MRRACLSIAMLVFFVLPTILTGCSNETTVRRVFTEPSRFEGKEVSLTDTVGDSRLILGLDSDKVCYWLGGDIYKLLVITEHEAPAKGTRVSIKGIVQRDFQTTSEHFGLVIIETQRD